MKRQFHVFAALGIVIGTLTPAPLAFGQAESNPVTDAAHRASIRRQEEMARVQNLLLEGDRKLADEDIPGAYDTYKRAFQAAPMHALGKETRMMAFSKYQESMLLHADQMARQGRIDDAIALVEEFYREAQRLQIPAGAVDRKTALLLQDLRDGETYEPGQSPRNLEKVGKIRELFTQADASAQLGRYDEATQLYFEILNLDPYSQAARRGLENLDRLINAYNKAAYDHTRAKMLGEVSAMWESPVPRLGISGLADTAFRPLEPSDDDSIRARLTSIIIPDVEFENTPLRDALRFLSQRSKQLDRSGKGVDIIVSADTDNASNLAVTLRLRDVPLGAVLDYVTQSVRMKYRIDQYAVTVVPLTAADDESLVTKRYRVPPDFISGGALGGGDPAADDPFADLGGGGGGGGGVLQPKLTAEAFLKNNGIQFPEGATAKFFPSTSTLLIRNTHTQLELIETLIDSAFGSVAKLLRFDIKVLDITQNQLTELGIDWLLGKFNVGNSERVFASGGTPGTTAPIEAPDFPFVAPNTTIPVGDHPLTAGNRSGQPFIDTVDQVLIRDNADTEGKAPAAFAVSGVFTDPQFQAVLRTLHRSGGKDGLSNMSVLTKAGEVASLQVIREFIYPTEYDPPEIPDTFADIITPIVPANPAAFETREVGSLIEVNGAIGPDGQTVSVTLNPQVVEFEGFINYGSPILLPTALGLFTSAENRILMPLFRTIREDTTVNVYDGHTIVIGGLLNETRAIVQDKVPILGDIPFIGKLFCNEVHKRDRRAIVLFVTANIVDPSGVSIKQRAAQQAAR